MSEMKEEDNKLLKLKLSFGVIICGFVIISTIFGMNRWMIYGFIDNDDLSYLITIVLGTLCLLSTFHLWSRVPNLQGKLKKLFFLTGITFIVVLMIFIYVLMSIYMRWSNIPQIFDDMSSNIEFHFSIFDFEISVKSAFNFCLALIALIFYTFPIETYVKQHEKKFIIPWHSLSICGCMVIVPFIFFLRDIMNYELILNIFIIIIGFIVFYDCLFLFYLYFSTGMKSPKGTPMRRAGILIAFGLFGITSLLIMRVGLLVMIPSLMRTAVIPTITLADIIIQIPLSASGILLFNYGFYLIRPT